MRRVRCVSGIMGWRERLRAGYENFEEFLYYSANYGLARRLGFSGSREAWEANPMVEGSVIPSDFRITPAKGSKQQAASRNFVSPMDKGNRNAWADILPRINSGGSPRQAAFAA